MKAVTIAAALVYGLSIAPAFALFDGNELWESCNGDMHGDRGFCQGYVSAVVDSHHALMSEDNYFFCRPKGVIVRQYIDVVKKSLADHPQDRHRRAADLVFEALMEAFPCKR